MFWTFLLNYAMRQVSSLPEEADLPPWIREKRLGDWRLAGSIGKGNFGEVFLAEDTSGNRKALKVFTPEAADRRAFDLEYDGMEAARMMAKHPNIVPIESVGRTEYCIYYTMPLADALREEPYVPHTLYNRMVKNDLAEAELLELLNAHLQATGSEKAKRILSEWEMHRSKFVRIFPVEYRHALEQQRKGGQR